MRFIALLLLILMCFSFLASCPQKPAGSTDKEKATAAKDKSAGEEGNWENGE
jgi:curli biogenesis system outer membrane secretion channel CsgG